MLRERQNFPILLPILIHEINILVLSKSICRKMFYFNCSYKYRMCIIFIIMSTFSLTWIQQNLMRQIFLRQMTILLLTSLVLEQLIFLMAWYVFSEVWKQGMPFVWQRPYHVIVKILSHDVKTRIQIHAHLVTYSNYVQPFPCINNEHKFLIIYNFIWEFTKIIIGDFTLTTVINCEFKKYIFTKYSEWNTKLYKLLISGYIVDLYTDRHALPNTHHIS